MSEMLGSRLQRQPLYTQVAQSIEKEIADGRWPLNKAIPSETQLATDFGVSVGTVRKALDILSDRGRLVKKQGLRQKLRGCRLLEPFSAIPIRGRAHHAFQRHHRSL